MKVRVLSPERVILDEEVESFALPTARGEMGVLRHHMDLVGVLVPGIARFKTSRGEEELAIDGGCVEVRGDVIIVLVDHAERGEDLDMSAIDEAVARAKTVMRETVRRDDVAFAHATAILERELARSKLARRHRSRVGSR